MRGSSSDDDLRRWIGISTDTANSRLASYVQCVATVAGLFGVAVALSDDLASGALLFYLIPALWLLVAFLIEVLTDYVTFVTFVEELEGQLVRQSSDVDAAIFSAVLGTRKMGIRRRDNRSGLFIYVAAGLALLIFTYKAWVYAHLNHSGVGLAGFLVFTGLGIAATIFAAFELWCAAAKTQAALP